MFADVHFLSRERVAHAIDPGAAPRLEVAAPCELIVETHDARGGRLKQPEDVITTAPDFSQRFPRTNPATGPVRIQGAEPGDVLTVEVLDIRLDSYGFVMVKPDMGLVRGLVNEPVAKVCPVEDGLIHFGGLRLAVRPMIGVLATAPAHEAIATAHVGPHGGNMDCNRVTVGTKVHLPVRVPGAHFYVGDIHAAMGDAEVTGSGLEIGARVHLALSLCKGGARDWPWMETPDLWITTGSAPDYQAASEIAVREMMGLLVERLGVTAVEAFMLLSVRGDVRVNQACRSTIDTSVRVEFPKPGAGLYRG
ncbi:MAG TPA: acetamidase/formamidase family protein [Geminicoccaceae bacterium]|nr:acetamidase/formamidase family protein [Geminicoccus sp.]HMU51390.1 acetamidase/formamidase family protein [Geminicoccaceae bacterium]